MRWCFWVMLGVVLLWGSFSIAQKALDPEVLEHRKKGITFFKEKKYAEAIAEFQAFLEVDSTNVQVLHAVGACYHNQGKYDEAMVYFRKAIALDSSFVNARRDLAEALYAKARNLLARKKDEAALKGFLEAASMDSLNAKIPYHIGLVYAQMNRIDEAMDAYRRASELDTAYAAPNIALGRIFLKREAYPQAIQYLERGLTIDHRDTRVPKNLAVAYERVAHRYRQEGNYAAAIEAARKSLKYDPDHIASRVVLGEAYEALGQIEKAVEQYEIAKSDLLWQQYVEDKIKRLTKTNEDTE